MLDIPEWTVSLYDLNNQEVMDISRFVSLKLNLKLNDVSTCEFSLDLVQFERACAAINAHPRNILYPAKTEIRVSRNGNALFGGIIAKADSNFNENDAQLDVAADSYLQYFATRLLNKSYISTDRSQIAWDAINEVQSVAYGDLGITQGNLATTFNSDLTCDYRDVKSIIQLYTYAQPTTYDFEITPDKVFNTYSHLGSNRPEYELTYPGNIARLGIPRSSDTLFNKIVGIGSGIGEERIQTIKEDAISQATYRVRESKQTFNSVERQDTLEENTEGFLNQSTGVLVLPNVTIQSDAIDLDVVRVGDSLPVRCENSTFNDDLNGMFRIYGMEISVDEQSFETITLDFYKPDAGGELE